jgi:hypothetical protein
MHNANDELARLAESALREQWRQSEKFARPKKRKPKPEPNPPHAEIADMPVAVCTAITIGCLIYAIAVSLDRHQITNHHVAISSGITALVVLLGGLIITRFQFTWLALSCVAAYGIATYL